MTGGIRFEDLNALPIDDEVEVPTIAETALDRKRANMARARKARMSARTANARTAADPQPSAPVAPAERAAPAREASLPEHITRRPRAERQISGLDLPTQYKKPGWDYEYKTVTVFNQPVDPSDLQDSREAGWRPVLGKDFPTLMIEGVTDPNAPIERKGQRLYARPLRLTMEAKQEDYDIAREQQMARMEAAGAGRSAGRGHQGMSSNRGVKVVPIELDVQGVSG